MLKVLRTLFLTGALMVPAAATQATELTYGSYISPTTGTYTEGLEPFFKRVETATKGEVKFKAFLSGTMGGPKDLVSAVNSNIIDSAAWVDSYIPATLPYSTMLSLLGQATVEPLAFSAAANEFQLLHCPGCKADYDRSHAVLLALQTTATYHLMCKAKTTTLQDVAGKKVRGSGQGMAKLLKDLGATPVSISSKEIYEAMQRGQVDCTAGPTSWLKNYNLGEFVKSIVKTSMGAYGTGGLLMVNADVWKGLSSEQRKAIEGELGQLVADVNFSQLEEAVTAQEKAVADGAVVYDGGPDFNAVIEKAQAATWKEAQQDSEANGVKDAGPVLKDFAEVLAKWNGIMKTIGTNDKAAYAEALNREIFSKLPH